MRMNPNSLFAILLRSPWWVSFLVAFGIGAVARLLLPESLTPYAWFFALPFAAVGCAAVWQQWRQPGAEDVAATLDRIRGAGWEAFSAALGEAYRRQGHAVSAAAPAGADLELERDGRLTLVACKRWKAATTGIEPLKELAAAREKRGARYATYVSAGELSSRAQAFARENDIQVLQGAELAALLAPTLPKETKT